VGSAVWQGSEPNCPFSRLRAHRAGRLRILARLDPIPGRAKNVSYRMTNRYSLLPVARRPLAGEGDGAEQTQVVYIPLNCPWTRPATHPGTGRGYSFSYFDAE
jgi:hypothetical protein